MSANYSKSSPYYSTKKYGIFLDILEYRVIEKHPTDTIYTIDKIYAFRPDLLAYDLYGDSALWWVFRVRNPNTLEDPIMDFSPGKTIYIPDKETLLNNLGI